MVKIVNFMLCNLCVFVCVCVCVRACSVLINTLQSHGLGPSRLLGPSNFPGKYTGVGCHFLLQGIFPIQGLNLCLLHWQADALPLHHMGSPFVCFIPIFFYFFTLQYCIGSATHQHESTIGILFLFKNKASYLVPTYPVICEFANFSLFFYNSIYC